MVVALIILAWLGLAFGSFVNALTWRLHEQGKKKKANNPNLSIISGRSLCPHCKHILVWYDLVPVLSWLGLRGRCRYCKKTISVHYPLVELAGAFIFAGSYAFWPHAVHYVGDWVLFITWLVTSVGLLALLIYDLRWMLLPNKIIYPTFAAVTLGRVVYILGYSPHKFHDFLMWILSVIVASGIFFVLYVISNGKWIGFGDIRLGLITGTVLAAPAKSFLMIFLGSVLGTLSIIPGLITGNKTINSKLPYGPFLIVGCLVALLFGSDILDWYKHTFLP